MLFSSKKIVSTVASLSLCLCSLQALCMEKNTRETRWKKETLPEKRRSKGIPESIDIILLTPFVFALIWWAIFGEL